MTIKWHLEERKLSELKDNPLNPRRLSKEAHRKLKHNLEMYGVIDKPCINTDGTLIGGHQRRKVLKEMGFKTVEVWVPDRELNPDEMKKLNVVLNKVGGEFDFDMLGNLFDAEDLLEVGFEEKELADLLPDIDDLGSSGEEGEQKQNKKCTMTITFACVEDLQDAENKISVIVDAYDGSSYKVKI